MKLVREQYLKLAQKYHPDTVQDKKTFKNNDEAFIQVKESHDKIVILNKEQNGELFLSVDAINNQKAEENEKVEDMADLKQRVKQKKEREIELKRRQK